MDVEQAFKVYEYLEAQSERNPHIFFSVNKIQSQTNVGNPIITEALRQGIEQEAVLSKVIKGETRYQWNPHFRTLQTLREMVKNGYITEPEPGKFKLTLLGEQYARSLIKVDPEIAAFYQRLVQS